MLTFDTLMSDSSMTQKQIQSKLLMDELESIKKQQETAKLAIRLSGLNERTTERSSSDSNNSIEEAGSFEIKNIKLMDKLGKKMKRGKKDEADSDSDDEEDEYRNMPVGSHFKLFLLDTLKRNKH